MPEITVRFVQFHKRREFGSRWGKNLKIQTHKMFKSEDTGNIGFWKVHLVIATKNMRTQEVSLTNMCKIFMDRMIKFYWKTLKTEINAHELENL